VSASQRTKGQRGERELFALLSGELGSVVRRRVDSSRDGGCDSLDIDGWAIECKERNDFCSHSGIKLSLRRRPLNGGRCSSGVSRVNRGRHLWTCLS
jgi:hypothetical protein